MTRVTVLLGGISAEREVSLVSGQQCAAALRDAGFAVETIDVGHDPAVLITTLRAQKPDAVFNALHGRFGEDGCVQGLLDWMGLPYTHSGLRASATAMDKAAAKAVFRAAGLPVARDAFPTLGELEATDPLPLPYVVKPIHEGSSVGVHIFRERDNRRAEIARNWTHGQMIAEEFIPGRELTVAVLGDEALTVTEIAPRSGFYDYEAKYADGGSVHLLPARMHPDVARDAMRIAVAAHFALGCRGVSRADFRYDDTAGEPGRLVLLEVNTQPGMTPTSLVPEQAAFRGIGFADLCARLVAEARHGA